jgi:hypothetical protein
MFKTAVSALVLAAALSTGSHAEVSEQAINASKTAFEGCIFDQKSPSWAEFAEPPPGTPLTNYSDYPPYKAWSDKSMSTVKNLVSHCTTQGDVFCKAMMQDAKMCPFMLDAFAGSVMQKYGKTLPHYHDAAGDAQPIQEMVEALKVIEQRLRDLAPNLPTVEIAVRSASIADHCHAYDKSTVNSDCVNNGIARLASMGPVTK